MLRDEQSQNVNEKRFKLAILDIWPASSLGRTPTLILLLFWKNGEFVPLVTLGVFKGYVPEVRCWACKRDLKNMLRDEKSQNVNEKRLKLAILDIWPASPIGRAPTLILLLFRKNGEFVPWVTLGVFRRYRPEVRCWACKRDLKNMLWDEQSQNVNEKRFKLVILDIWPASSLGRAPTLILVLFWKRGEFAPWVTLCVFRGYRPEVWCWVCKRDLKNMLRDEQS